MATNGMDFLNDVQMAVARNLYQSGHGLLMAESIAESAKEAVWSHFQRSTLYIPNFKHYGSEERVLELFREGKSAVEIIKATGLSQCTVYTHIRNRNRISKKKQIQDTSGSKEIFTMKMIVAKELLRRSIEPEMCKKVSEDFQTFIQKNWGGTTFSIPRLGKLNKDKSRRSIASRYSQA